MLEDPPPTSTQADVHPPATRFQFTLRSLLLIAFLGLLVFGVASRELYWNDQLRMQKAKLIASEVAFLEKGPTLRQRYADCQLFMNEEAWGMPIETIVDENEMTPGRLLDQRRSNFSSRDSEGIKFVINCRYLRTTENGDIYEIKYTGRENSEAPIYRYVAYQGEHLLIYEGEDMVLSIGPSKPVE